MMNTKATPNQPVSNRHKVRRVAPLASSAGRFKLHIPDAKQRFPGYHLYWAVNRGGDVDEKLRAGYDFVYRDEAPDIGDVDLHSGDTGLNSQVSRTVGTDELGEIKAFLMKQKLEWHLEDQANHSALNDEIDKAIRGGDTNSGSVENAYGGVQVDSN